MSDVPESSEWWLGTDGKWYPPVAAARSPIVEDEPVRETARQAWWRIGFLVAALAVGGVWLMRSGASGDSNQSASESAAILAESLGMSTGEIGDTSWVPAGFTRNGNTAWRWSEERTKGSGWAVEVYARYGCSSLYVELSVVDDAGRVVGFTNDSVSGLRSKETALLQFRNIDDGEKARLAKVSCR